LQLKSKLLLKGKSTTSNLLLLLAAIIWGFAFVAQRAGMEHIGPFTLNGIRFLLGGLSLLPLLLLPSNRKNPSNNEISGWNQRVMVAGLIAGLVLFVAATLQQIGMVYTTAGKAGFITGLYVILVPVLGIFVGQHTKINVWIGAFVAAAGLYFLCITDDFTLETGDEFVLVSAVFFAVHIVVISRFSKNVSIIRLSIIQFFTCSFFSLVAAFATDEIEFSGIQAALVPILYGGIFSVGIAYTLQVAGQKHAHPSSASIILSLESLFALLGGWIILSEQMSVRGLAGCALMLSGMVLAQIRFRKNP
jgi:drug/metabolite transporter (DMT)-like permease